MSKLNMKGHSIRKRKTQVAYKNEKKGTASLFPFDVCLGYEASIKIEQAEHLF